ncbi:hypothetical protein [Roseospira visakhapatnamensis]|uniref:Uncharacterized protein n=1 Tax=Roseospira visakhapatnamensis TaxID=390880 RepID=A0A7W6RET5_9PROT|nr:hypothetical protein [Roseospira visakhapatnamensis]MBB4267158.1 hypothetical protein [Roseospira visakhapatnamensis]
MAEPERMQPCDRSLGGAPDGAPDVVPEGRDPAVGAAMDAPDRSDAGDAAARVPDDDEAQSLEALFLRHDQRRHPVDLRLSIPWFKRGLYVVILGGRELRSPPRLRKERDRHPIITLGNALLAVSVLAIVYALALVALVAFQGMRGDV